EYGCNTQGTREFSEVASIYSTQMSSVFSGGLVYEYSQEADNYGLVEINGDSVTTLDDFNNLKDMLNSTTDPTGDGGYVTTNTASSCPTGWDFDINVPDTPSDASSLFEKGAGEGSGFDAETQESCDGSFDYSDVSSSEVVSSSTKTSASSTK
ncbi:hypothetical protein WICPIJ_002885, partial [Wickerhamomyces pijperi]